MRRIISKAFFFTLFLFGLIGCKGSQSSSGEIESKQDKKPYWLSGQGIDEGYYVGVGYSAKSDGNYVQIAKNSALQSLISEIKVNVSSSSILTQVDVNDQFKEQYESVVQTSAAEEIQDFELAGSYEENNGYWVYYRLSRTKYALLKAQEKQDAIDLSMQMRKRAIKDYEEGNLASSLSYYAKSFKSLEKFLGEATRVEIEGETVFLGVDLFSSVQSVLGELKIETPSNKIVTDRRLVEGLKIPVMVTNAKSGNPEEGIPIRASFSVGGGEVHPEYYTNAEGEAKVLVSRIDSRDALQKIKIAVDPSVFLGEGEKQLSGMVLQSLVQPKEFVEISVDRPSIYVVSNELVFGKEDPSLSYTPLIKSALTKAGFTLNQSKGKGSLKMEISGSMDKNPISGPTHITYSSVQISVSDAKSGEQIFQGGFSKVKGYSNDYESSARYAYKEGKKLLEKEKLPELIKSILR
jgi:LPP20 lipoprotein